MLLPGLGTRFMDGPSFSLQAEYQQNTPRSALLARAKVAEELGLPRAAHIYVVGCPLQKVSARFDEAVTRLLVSDRLGFVVFVDTAPVRQSSKQVCV